MPAPSRNGGPAAMPKYQRIAAALRHDLDRAAHTPGGRLPSERTLAARYEVNRQTIRAALQQLREDGLVVTGRRGTRPSATLLPVPSRALASPVVGPAAGVVAQSRLNLVTVPPSLAALLHMRGGERTLVHHRRERGPAGETLQHAVTYLCPQLVARTPELAGLRDRTATAALADEGLAPLHRWLERAAAGARVAETVTMTRTSDPYAAAPTCGLTVRRTLHDGAGRLIAVTDLAFPTWDRLTIHRDRAATGFRVTQDS
ncbi:MULTISPECIES: GntR family transcriptional regulator [unclassified Streptomyces]|uniref:GntR family transcriptional regulator n=1 Tax=unclassified Streptomyces TaxID=2593676 RepID=UPI002254EDF1|nr:MULTISPECIES: GntR family transcriptional regulator [unclassified Streptomyces]MCX4529783.1 GntR family transcriptional regulator [Streptomyces sp. NBC_01551]MCX4539645.1 GntR family transcriptional regulator [Streptomyces sp. NBC_01565]